jgi:hypothetical protein
MDAQTNVPNRHRLAGMMAELCRGRLPFLKRYPEQG